MEGRTRHYLDTSTPARHHNSLYWTALKEVYGPLILPVAENIVWQSLSKDLQEQCLMDVKETQYVSNIPKGSVGGKKPKEFVNIGQITLLKVETTYGRLKI